MLISTTVIEPSSRQDDTRSTNASQPSQHRGYVHPILAATDVMDCRAHVERVMRSYGVDVNILNGVLTMFDVALLGTVRHDVH